MSRVKHRIIINIWDDTPVPYALRLVDAVVRGGRISKTGKDDKPCYCFASTFDELRKYVYADLTRTGNDIFTITSGNAE